MPGRSFEAFKETLLDITLSATQSGLRIFLIIAIGLILLRVLRFLMDRLEAVMIRAKEPGEAIPGAVKKRVHTLVGILRTVARFAIWAVVIVISLDQMGVNVTPIIAGAGIAGLALGFGAQNLVRDVITGFFMILEDQVRVGDVAIINGTGGLVEAITFRTIVLRDLSGVVHIFPNGNISNISNMTKTWSAYVIDVGVAYKEDTDRVVEVMKTVDDDLRRDPAYGPKILQPIEVFGVDDFGASEVIIKARLKTLPIEQWSVGREFRRRLKKAFDAQGIEIPFPHRSIYFGEASKPFEHLVRQMQAKA